MGSTAYKLLLPPEAKIHPVFHVSMLRPALGPQQSAIPLPSSLTEELEWLLEPETMMALRPGTQFQQPQVLIKWLHLPEFEATWEDFNTIQQ